MSIGVVIVAAGRGARFGGAVPKQLVDLGGRTLLQRSVDAFAAHARIEETVVVLPSDLVSDGPSLVGPTRHQIRFVAGGDRRQDSVRFGVAALSSSVDLVLIHDAARPFADPALIDRVIAGAEEKGAAIPAVPARDTVKRADSDNRVVRETIPRQEIWLAQTPQGFTRRVLEDVVAASSQALDATDEAMLAERAGHPVAIVMGDERNVKITTSDDLAAARSSIAAAVRVGTGYDLHRLAAGRPLVLAGVTVPSDRGPVSHSDGDVICHAAIDAMLGAAGCGDIGRHFPDTDPQWKDSAGLDLLRRAARIVREAGWAVTNIDATVILERPKIAPHVGAIRAAMAEVLGVDVDRVSVKAKTNEGVDAVGRGEAIAAHAVASLTSASPRG
jgi:2-C-methyl-D-erythritol 4-phosphate cytidylyltransferase / 2-C-methyl-D-erythritol 2,4-cyclodiphosphate synthase